MEILHRWHQYSNPWRVFQRSSERGKLVVGTLVSKRYSFDVSGQQLISLQVQQGKRGGGPSGYSRCLSPRNRFSSSICFICCRCTVCVDKVFKSAARLANHLKLHSGERPFACSVCHATFRNSSNVSRHVKRQHSNEQGLARWVTEQHGLSAPTEDDFFLF